MIQSAPQHRNCHRECRDPTEAPPIRQDCIRRSCAVGDSRVLLELVIQEFQDGATPEMIVQQYDTLALPDVYAVIGCYLRHREETKPTWRPGGAAREGGAEVC